MSYYNTGLAPTSARGLQTTDTNVIGGATGGAAAPTSYAPTPQPGQGAQGVGGIQAPNAALQNITNFSGSLGTLMGNANMSRGLQSYNAYNMGQGMGNIGGQTTPWGLRSAEEGGFGGDANSYQRPGACLWPGLFLKWRDARIKRHHAQRLHW